MRAPPGIMLDSLDKMHTRSLAVKVHNSDAAFVPATTVTDGDVAGVVAATERLALLRECEREDRAALVDMVVYWADEMTDARSSGSVAAKG